MNLKTFLVRLFLGRRLPISTGTLSISGLSSSIKISRDSFGIPSIQAQNDLDAFFGMGFCHAQDRAGQLEGWLRLGRGKLSEIAGPRTLGIDQLLRRIGFNHAAQKQWPVLSPQMQEVLQAYVNGINAGYKHGWKKRPHEFFFLKTPPTEWTPYDVLALLKMQCWFMACNWDSELARLAILRNDGPEALTALDPLAFDSTGLTDSTSQPSPITTIQRLLDDVKLLGEIVPKMGGSNNWVVSPSKSATGRPLLANDPHLGASVPAPWYLLSVQTPDWSLAGASFVGSPTVPSGHNGHAAWGVTAGLSDNTDLFIEDVQTIEGKWHYRQGETYLPCEVRRETISVKKGSPVEMEVVSTPRGPIISPSLPVVSEALSLRAVWLDPLPVQGWLTAFRAKDFDTFRQSFREWPGFPMNLVYADMTGKTGWQLVGQVPVRKRGNGLIPLAGWDDRNGWHKELLPFEKMPFVEDPKEGFVATANNRPIYENDGAYLGCDWLDRYRHDVIAEALQKLDKVTLKDCSDIQQSFRCMPWEEIRDVILQYNLPAVENLKKWDGNITADSYEATIYQLFMAKMSRRLAEVKAPKSVEIALGGALNELNDHSFFSFRRYSHLVKLLNTQPEGWFEKGWKAEIESALEYAHGEAWGTAWGTIRPLVLDHLLMGKSPLASLYNVGPFAFGGDEHTPNHASALPLDVLDKVQSLPNLRTIIDVGNWSACRFQLSGGQSGNPFSKNYADLMQMWLKAEGVPIAFTKEEIEKSAQDVLVLEPK